jgi:hypothetical protein
LSKYFTMVFLLDISSIRESELDEARGSVEHIRNLLDEFPDRGAGVDTYDDVGVSLSGLIFNNDSVQLLSVEDGVVSHYSISAIHLTLLNDLEK